MKQISKLLIILTTLILFSCNTGRQVVYRDCDCDRTSLSFGWGFNDPYWGWNNPWRWNDPYWSWRTPHWGWNNWYWVNPPIVRPNTPSRYERRQTIGSRPSRGAGMDGSRDNLYPTNPSRVETRTRNSYQYYEPSQRTETPSRSRVEVQTRPNYRYSEPSNRTTTQTPSRVESTRPSRSYTPQVQERSNTPNTQSSTPSRRGNQNN